MEDNLIYLVNAGDNYYPREWNVIFITKNKEEADKKAAEAIEIKDREYGGKRADYDWSHLVTLNPATLSCTGPF